MSTTTPAGVWRGDFDGLIALFFDNLINFLLIVSLGVSVLGLSPELIASRIVPGCMLSVLFGNLYFARKAKTLGPTATAFPFGISSVALMGFIYLLLLPAKNGLIQQGVPSTDIPLLLWQIGMAACFTYGLLIACGAGIASWLRKHAPKPALLAALGGIAFTFLVTDFVVGVFAQPIIAFVPLGIFLLAYAGKIRLPFGWPASVWALGVGTVLYWVMPHEAPQTYALGVYFPLPFLGDLFAGLSSPWLHRAIVPVIVPLVVSNLVGTVQNVESAQTAGDSYSTRSSIIASGAASMLGAVFGGCFGTTIYLGHPGWKSLGATWRYSNANAALLFVLTLTGLLPWVAEMIPLQAGYGIIIWIGVNIVAQAFTGCEKREAVAVAFGVVPAIAAWGHSLLRRVEGSATNEALTQLVERISLLAHGFLLTSLVWTSVIALMMMKRLQHAAFWLLGGAVLSTFGFTHQDRFFADGFASLAETWSWPAGYLCCAAMCFAAHHFSPTGDES